VIRKNGQVRLSLIVAAIAVILCWAYSPIGIRIGLKGYGAGQLALMRFLIASTFMLIIALFKRISLPRLKDLPWLIMLGLFAVTLHHIALNTGQRGISAGASSVLAQSTPIFSTLIARFYLDEKVTAWRWSCVFIGMAGAIIVIMGDDDFTAFNMHGLLILLAALSWSIYFTLQKRYSQHYSVLTIVCYTVWSGTGLLSLYFPGLVVQVMQAPARVNIAVVLLGIFPSALAYLWWAYVLAHIEVSRAATALYLVPPVAMMMAAVLLHEKTSLMVILGGGIIIGSVLALNTEQQIKAWQVKPG
jgi:drug/metabolite transporter (DMT)-like permease